jgi:hypothetical protein
LRSHPLARIMSPVYLYQSPSRSGPAGSHPARDLCTFAAADKTDVQPPRDLITAANVKRQAGGRRGSGANLHRNGLSKCTTAHRKLLAVKDGPHLGVDVIRAIKEHLQADRQQVRQSLLAATPHITLSHFRPYAQTKSTDQITRLYTQHRDF